MDSRQHTEAMLDVTDRAIDEIAADPDKAAKMKDAYRRYAQGVRFRRYGGRGDEPVEEVSAIQPIRGTELL